MKFIEHRITDKRILRHIKKWLNAGVLEDGQIRIAEEGTPQGGSISPLLANIYLHYSLDKWADWWRKKKAKGEVLIVRFADDTVFGFQYQDDAQNFLDAMRKNLSRYNLELNGEKTRLIEFGRFAAATRKKEGKGKPDTFDFLGFTHICGKTRNGKFCVLRQTKRKKMTSKLKELRIELVKRMHQSVPEVGRWLGSILQGHYRYYGVPRNLPALDNFRRQLIWIWLHILRRRSQKRRLTCERMNRLTDRWLPRPFITHPYPDRRLVVKT